MADKENIYGIRYEVDIESLKTSTVQAQKQVNLANAEFEKSSSTLERWSESSEGLSAKLKQLNSILDAQKNKLNHQKNDYNNLSKEIEKNGKSLDELNRKRENAIAQYGNESKEVKELDVQIKKLERSQNANKTSLESLNIQILKQEANVNKTERSMKYYGEQLDDVSEAQKRAEKSGRSLTDELKDLKKATNDADEENEKLGDGFTVLKGTIANFIANGISKVISGIGSAIEQSREFRVEMAKLKVVSDQLGANFQDTQRQFKELLSTSNDEGASTEALNNLLSAGFKGDNMDEVIKGVQGIALQFKDTLKQEGIADSIQEWIGSAGESLTGNFAEWLERMGYNLEEVSKQTKGFTDAQRQQWIIDQMAKQGVMDITDAYKEQNKGLIDSSNAQFDYNNTIAKLGEKVEPIFTAVKQGVADIIAEFLKMSEGINFEEITDKITSVFKWIIENKDLVIAGIMGIVAGLTAMGVANMIMGVVNAFKAFKTAQEGATIGQWLLNVAMSANPIGILIALIAGLVSAFIYLWNKSESFRKFWIDLWNNVVEFCSNTVDSIVSFFTVTIPKAINDLITWFKQLTTKISEFLSTALQSVITWATNMINKAIEVGTNFLNTIVQFFTQLPIKILAFINQVYTNITTWATNMINKAIEVGTNFVSSIIQFIVQLPQKIVEILTLLLTNIALWGINLLMKAQEIGSSFLNGVILFVQQLPQRFVTVFSTIMTNLINFATNMFNKAVEAGLNFYNGIVNKLNEIPAKVLEIGANIVRGIWEGISSMGSWLWDQVTGWANGIVNGLKDLFGIHSPSTITTYFGEMLGMGTGNGLINSLSGVLKKSKTFANKVMGTLKNGLSEKLSINPEIVSNLKSKAKGLLNGINASALQLAGANGGLVQNYSFNQYNTDSPKSRWEIMRQTRNLLLQTKKG